MLTIVQPEIRVSSFEELRDRGRHAAEVGHLDEALELLHEALELARREGTDELVDLAFCNYSAVLITVGRQAEVMSRLRQILVHNACAENCFLAAYNLSRAHVRNKEYKKGLFYARIARDRAEGVDQVDWRVMSYNQVANCLGYESYFEEATAEFRKSLALQDDRPSLARAFPLVNLGYCLMMQDQVRAGMAHCFRALRWFRRFSAPIYEVWPHLFLCYGYLEIGRSHRARQHGLRVLELAEASGDPDRLKTALYLLGETEREAGNAEGAHEHFSNLHRRFYPDAPEVAHLMVAVGMRQLVNLRV